ncbi:FkbM family methyltransferase [Bernardetia sp. Wsw4-3y2]|uniref:FkbM family methyltransferase n=1 Tax=unclassified Bernardetia TaxID=2647129 RepID=UPI0030D574B9
MKHFATSYDLKNNHFLSQFLSKLHYYYPPKMPITTNFGISPNLKLVVEPSSTVSSVYLFGTPMQYDGERGPLYLSLLLMNNKKYYLDIGSHYGYFSFFLRTHLSEDKIIHYFEPNELLYSFTENAIQSNNLKNIYGHKFGVGKESGETIFYINHTDSSCSSLNDNYSDKHQLEQVKINVISLNNFVEQSDINAFDCVIKIDVENAEYLIEKGATNVFKKVDYLIMEVLGPAINDKFISHMVNEYGFYAYYINDFQLEYCPDKEESYIYSSPQYNWLFTRRKPNELKQIVKNSHFRIKDDYNQK